MKILITGGIHTPNHRWVVSCALTKLYELWPDQRYMDRANQWLRENIDPNIKKLFTKGKIRYVYPLTDDARLHIKHKK